MARITIEYDARNTSAKKMIEAILALPFFKVQGNENKKELIPNDETKKAIKDAHTGEGCKTYKNSTEMFKSLDINV